MDETYRTTFNLLMHESRAEHNKLHQLLSDVRNQFGACDLRSGDARGRCYAEVVRRLQQHLETHFAHEEGGGWLEEAVVHAPHLAHRLTQLEREHGPLLEQAAHLITIAESLDRTGESPAQLQAEFEQLSVRLLKHEADEAQVLADGFNEELDIK
jgi:hypothetical protein